MYSKYISITAFLIPQMEAPQLELIRKQQISESVSLRCKTGGFF